MRVTRIFRIHSRRSQRRRRRTLHSNLSGYSRVVVDTENFEDDFFDWLACEGCASEFGWVGTDEFVEADAAAASEGAEDIEWGVGFDDGESFADGCRIVFVD